ncbi:hypothetical protein NLX83_22155 [Allokutzneria sp. A3M-2-11 16]|uniref:hypothetical protein n=1 Tax=Allokutzneria sp. A3M-2-11 16 TaxID=2962043 RepID=UPI0020B7B147|nr:hypothetical protein [Allokutzneria sp. A3M-2-11 16]MCP3801974.1 hypothetical protein [Allokutzneria sp. A3M-2-11 16]
MPRFNELVETADDKILTKSIARDAATEHGTRLVVIAAAESMPRRVIDTVGLTTTRRIGPRAPAAACPFGCRNG